MSHARTRGRALPPLTAWFALAACGAPEVEQPVEADAAFDAVDRWRPSMQVVVDHLQLEPGERVFGAGLPGLFDQLRELPGTLAQLVEEAGGVYVGTLSADGPYGPVGDASFVAAARGLDRAGLRDLLRDVPVGVMLPGASLGDPAYGAMADLLGEGWGSHRTVHFHWGGAYAVEARSIPVGAEAAANPTDDARADSVYRRAITEVDYGALAAAQAAFEAAARAGEIHITTPAGTDMRFRIGDRPVNRQDRDVSADRAAAGRIIIDREIEFPPGALRVAPLESTVHGVIALPRSRWNDEPVEDLVFTFDAGRITSITASAGESAVRGALDAAGEEPQAFRELGLGFNPLLAVPEEDPWLPYFGYGAGVVRLSLGDNSELGGLVGGGYVKWIFFLDATLEVDGERWVEDGRLIR